MLLIHVKFILSLIILTLLTISCGGSSSSKKSEITDIASDVDALSEERVSNETIIEEALQPASTFEIVADKEFPLNSTSLLDVNVDIPELRYERAYLNICREKADASADHNNCVFSAPLKNGLLETQLTLGNEVNTLNMEIWRYDIHSRPLAYRWIMESGPIWNVY